MNILMKDSDDQLVTIPIGNANLSKKDFESRTFTLIDSHERKNVYKTIPFSSASKQIFFETSTLDESTDDISNNQCLFLESLDFDTAESIQNSLMTEDIQSLDNNNTIIRSQDFFNSNDMEVIEEFEMPNSLDCLNNETSGKMDLVITNERSSQNCRLCSRRNERMIYIFGLSDEDNDIAEKINNCLPITVKKTDKFPKIICFPCLEKVEFIHSFCKTVSETEASFVNGEESLSSKLENKIGDSTIPEKKSCRSVSPVYQDESLQELDFQIDQLEVPEEQTSNSQDIPVEDNTKEDIRCRICNVKFYSRRKCFLHAASHSLSHYFPCGLCENISQTPEKWREHYTEHHNGRISDRREATYECTICNKKFIVESRLKFHLQFHEPGAKPCYCEKCDKFVTSESVLYHHSVMVHQQSKEFCCDICGIQYRSQAQLDIHQRKHNNERPYGCKICCKRFYSADSLRRHEKIHSSDKSCQCDQCGKTFDRIYSLNKHLLTHQVDARISMICQICKACSEVFFDTFLSGLHVQMCKEDFPLIEEMKLDTVYRCEFCQRCYASVSSAKIHSKTHSGPLPYTCTTCDVTFASYNQVTAHKSAHRKSNQDLQTRDTENAVTKFFFCDFCEKEFLHFTNMNMHRKSCRSKRFYTCSYCAAVFQTKQEFTRHKRRWEDDIRLICEYCNLSFGNECGFEIHKRVHTRSEGNGKLFTCTYCGKSFQQKTHLTIHLRSHTGERPFACESCNKRFTIKVDRDNHQRTHSGERPFKCTLCEKDFTNPARLREHMLHHSNIRPYKCDYCDQAFKKANARKVHTLIHTGEKPYQCDACGISFRRSGDLNKHKKSQHKSVSQNEKKPLL